MTRAKHFGRRAGPRPLFCPATAASTVSWDWTVAESRTIPTGRVAHYGIERLTPSDPEDGQESLAEGYVNAAP